MTTTSCALSTAATTATAVTASSSTAVPSSSRITPPKRPPFDKLDALCIRILTGVDSAAVAAATGNGGGGGTANAKPAKGRKTVGTGPLLVKQQKYFRVSVPQAFLGSELVQWLQENMGLDDAAEAAHMGTILCQHGYLFSVIDQSTELKNDGTLYRLQLPYYWASHNGTPDNVDNVEYAIYLNKRLMRNEEKHGLEQHEAELYNKLMELLGHVWDFIRVQAEMQLKIHKEKKKSERVVLDSQERAFWRMHRPPSGHNSHFEIEYQKQERKLRKKNARMYHQQIERLNESIKTKPWLKTPKATETLVSWTEQFADYDPLLSGCQPSNPWISDDTTLWALNADYVNLPTERRVRRWGFSVQELVKDPIGRQVLDTFLESEFSSENIRFWIAIQDLKYSPQSEVPTKVEFIYTEFLAPGAPCQVNVDSRTRDASTKKIHDNSVPQRFAFYESEEHVFTLMSKDSYPRFVRHDIYKNVLNASQQQGSKKLGWRNFLPNVKAGGVGSGAGGSAGQSGCGASGATDRSKKTVTGGGGSSSTQQQQSSSTGAGGKAKMSRDDSSVPSLKQQTSDTPHTAATDTSLLPPSLPANQHSSSSS